MNSCLLELGEVRVEGQSEVVGVGVVEVSLGELSVDMLICIASTILLLLLFLLVSYDLEFAMPGFSLVEVSSTR